MNQKKENENLQKKKELGKKITTMILTSISLFLLDL